MLDIFGRRRRRVPNLAAALMSISKYLPHASTGILEPAQIFHQVERPPLVIKLPTYRHMTASIIFFFAQIVTWEMSGGQSADVLPMERQGRVGGRGAATCLIGVVTRLATPKRAMVASMSLHNRVVISQKFLVLYCLDIFFLE